MPEARRIVVDGNEAAAAVAHRLSEVIAIYPITPSSPMGELADCVVGPRPHQPLGRRAPGHGDAVGGGRGGRRARRASGRRPRHHLHRLPGPAPDDPQHVQDRGRADCPSSCTWPRAPSPPTPSRSSATTPTSWPAGPRASRCWPRARCRKRRTWRRSPTWPPCAPASPSSISSTAFAPRTKWRRSRSCRTTTCGPAWTKRPCSRIAGARLTPDARSARHRAEPRHLLPGARGGERLLPGLPRSWCRRRWTLRGRTGRRYRLFDYVGHPEAERVIVHDGLGRGDRAGDGGGAGRARREGRPGQGAPLHPFSIPDFVRGPSARPFARWPCSTAPRSRARWAIRCTSRCWPRFGRRRTTACPTSRPRPVVGGRYGLSSKEFDPPMVKAIFARAEAERPWNHFTVGIVDDVTHLSLPTRPSSTSKPTDVKRAVFYGLGRGRHGGGQQELDQDHRRGNPFYAQGYFVYDSKKAGATTVSHLRFGPRPIRSAYLVEAGRLRGLPPVRVPGQDGRARARRPGRHLPPQLALRPTEIWDHLPREMQQEIVERRLRFFVIDAYEGGARGGHGRPHQHRDAGLLLRALRRAAARGGHRPHQGGDREDLRQARRGDGEAQLRGGGRVARAAPRSGAAEGRDRDPRAAAHRLGQGAGLREARDAR